MPQPQPPTHEVVNFATVVYRNGLFVPFDATEDTDRQTSTPMLESCLLNTLTVRRVPLAPVTQHRSATALRSPCRLSPHTSPRPSDSHYKISPEHPLSTSCSSILYTPYGSPRRTLSQSPHRSAMSPNVQPLKNNESPCQWVLMDDPLDRSSSPEVLHLCEQCDEEFNTILQLKLHTLRCQKVNTKPIPQVFRRAQHQQVKRQPPTQKPKKQQRPRPRPKKKPLPDWNRVPVASQEFVYTPASPKKQTVLKKESFLHLLGLQETKDTIPVLKSSSESRVMSNLQSMNVYRSVPFTHIPPCLRLRNNSFYPSQRAESHNAELISVNWRKVDNSCPAYPECHRKFVNFAERPPPPLKSKTSVLGSQALAQKRALKQPRLILKKLTSAEIRLAGLGINTQALLKEKPQRFPFRNRSRPRPRPKSKKPAPASRKSNTANASKSKNDKGQLGVAMETTSSAENSEIPCVATRLQDADMGEPCIKLDLGTANLINYDRSLQSADIRLSALEPRVVLTRISDEEIAWWRSRVKIQPPSLTPRLSSYQSKNDMFATLAWHEEDGVIVIDD